MAGIIQVICVCVICLTSANGFWNSRQNASPPRIVIINPKPPPSPPPTTPPPSCPYGQYLCAFDGSDPNYEIICIDNCTLCDGNYDCPHNDDEVDCNCGHPELDPHGDYTIISGNGYDRSIAELTCDSHFKIASGFCIMVACENGTWTTPSESCQAVCPHLPDVDHGTIQYSGLSLSDSLLPGAALASLVCDAGYEPSAAAIRNSQCDGNSEYAVWNGSPLGPCVEVPDCGHPELDPHGNYTIISGNGYDRSIAELTCDSHFKIASGFCIIVACENGTWTTPSESCQAVCPHLPDVDHGTIQYSGLSLSDSLLPGAALASLVCDAGYEPSAATIRNSQCVGNSEYAVWNGSTLGPCVEVPDCGHPELDPHGDYTIISGNGYDRSIAELTCDSHFKIASGFCIIVACENGTWSTPSESCQAVCPPLPDVVNGTIQYSGQSLPGSLLPGAASASLVCDAGYEPSAAAILTSQCVVYSEYAVWTGFPLGPCEVSECPYGWMLYGGSCYLLGDAAMTYSEALDYCTGIGANVVFLETEEENEFVKAKLNATGADVHYWLGIDDAIQPGVWRSSTSGQIVPFFDWASTPSNEPNNGATGSEQCVIFWKDSTPLSYLWGDAPCSFANTRPVCELKL